MSHVFLLIDPWLQSKELEADSSLQIIFIWQLSFPKSTKHKVVKSQKIEKGTFKKCFTYTVAQ